MKSTKLCARSPLGSKVPGRGKEFLWSLQVKQGSLFQVIIIMQINIWQTTREQSPKNLWLHLARTWRASRHGAAIHILRPWAPSVLARTALFIPAGSWHLFGAYFLTSLYVAFLHRCCSIWGSFLVSFSSFRYRLFEDIHISKIYDIPHSSKFPNTSFRPRF